MLVLQQRDSAKVIGENSDVIITMLPASHHVQQVVLGENGVLSGAKKGAVIIDMSSISPVVSKEIAAIAEKQGVEMLDAPVSGGEPKAKDGTLAIMVGGKEEVFEQVKDVLYRNGFRSNISRWKWKRNDCKISKPSNRKLKYCCNV